MLNIYLKLERKVVTLREMFIYLKVIMVIMCDRNWMINIKSK